MVDQTENLDAAARESLIAELSAQMLAPGTSNAERRLIGLRIRDLINGRSAEMVLQLEIAKGLRPKAAA